MTFDDLRQLVRTERDRRLSQITSETAKPFGGKYGERFQRELVGMALHQHIAATGKPIKYKKMVIGVAPVARGFAGLRATPNYLSELVDKLWEAEMKTFAADVLDIWRRKKVEAGAFREEDSHVTEVERFAQTRFSGFD